MTLGRSICFEHLKDPFWGVRIPNKDQAPRGSKPTNRCPNAGDPQSGPMGRSLHPNALRSFRTRPAWQNSNSFRSPMDLPHTRLTGLQLRKQGTDGQPPHCFSSNWFFGDTLNHLCWEALETPRLRRAAFLLGCRHRRKRRPPEDAHHRSAGCFLESGGSGRDVVEPRSREERRGHPLDFAPRATKRKRQTMVL